MDSVIAVKSKMEMTMSLTTDVMIVGVPQESILALETSPGEFAADFRMAAAMKYYELGRLSSGAAARLAGVPRAVFLARLAEYGVDTFRLTEEQLQRETRLA
jgi:predicted HTH domain antitoxin